RGRTMPPSRPTLVGAGAVSSLRPTGTMRAMRPSATWISQRTSPSTAPRTAAAGSTAAGTVASASTKAGASVSGRKPRLTSGLPLAGALVPAVQQEMAQGREEEEDED